MMQKVYGDECLSRSSICEWFKHKRFKEGQENLNDKHFWKNSLSVPRIKLINHEIKDATLSVQYSMRNPDHKLKKHCFKENAIKHLKCKKTLFQHTYAQSVIPAPFWSSNM